MELLCNSPAELQTFAHQFAHHLTPNSLLLLDGNLGSGKTTFVQYIGQALGITEPITSPTFTLVNQYHSGKLPLYHIDLYRLDKADHILDLHLEVYWQGQEVPSGITAIEWAEKLPPVVPLPKKYWRLIFTIDSDSARHLVCTYIVNSL